MPKDNLAIHLELVAIPLPKEKEGAYWLAIEILAALIWKRLENEVQSNQCPQQKRRPGRTERRTGA